MTDLTPSQRAESRLTEYERNLLSVTRSMFMLGEIDHVALRDHLTTRFAFDSEAADEFVNEACDANDQTPQQWAAANAQLAPADPVETQRRILTPRYGPRP